MISRRGALAVQAAVRLRLEVKRELAETFAFLSEPTLPFFWGGRIAMTTNRLPRLYRTQDGLISWIGCDVRGLALSMAMGGVNLMTKYAQPDDPQPMKDAIDTLNEIGVTFQRPTVYQLKIGDLSFYPGRGTIFMDGSPGAMAEKGLDALVLIIKGTKQKLHSTPLVADGPRPAWADDPVPILGSRPPYGKRRFS